MSMAKLPLSVPRLALVLSGLALGACGTASQPLPGPRPVVARLASQEAPAGGKWLAVQFHAHSRHSDDGRLEIADLIALARKQGLDALSISDHDTKTHFKDPEFKSDADLTLLHGYEWTSKEGHAGVHGTTDDTVVPWTEGKEKLLAHVTARRETLIVHHPHFPLGAAWKGGWDPRATAAEVWNSFYLYPTNVEGEVGLTFEHGIDRDQWPHQDLSEPDHSHYETQDLGDHLANEKAIRWWNTLLGEGKRIPITAASDFHRWPQSLAGPCTLVYARENTEAAILEALRAGRSQGVQGPRQMRIDLEIAGDDGSRLAMVGDTVAAQGALKVRARVEKARGQFLTLTTRNGQLARVQVPSDPWTYETTLPADRGKPDYVWARLDHARWPHLLTALTSPIYLNLD